MWPISLAPAFTRASAGPLSLPCVYRYSILWRAGLEHTHTKELTATPCVVVQSLVDNKRVVTPPLSLSLKVKKSASEPVYNLRFSGEGSGGPASYCTWLLLVLPRLSRRKASCTSIHLVKTFQQLVESGNDSVTNMTLSRCSCNVSDKIVIHHPAWHRETSQARARRAVRTPGVGLTTAFSDRCRADGRHERTQSLG